MSEFFGMLHSGKRDLAARSDEILRAEFGRPLIIVDTRPLIAAADADDHDHERCVAMFQATRRPWLVPQPVIAEVCYLLERERGSQADAAFLRSFGRRELTPR